MKGEKIELSQRQLQRMQVMGLVEVGKGLSHGNRGMASKRRTDEGKCDCIIIARHNLKNVL